MINVNITDPLQRLISGVFTAHKDNVEALEGSKLQIYMYLTIWPLVSPYCTQTFVNCSSGNGLPPIPLHLITWTDADLSSVRTNFKLIIKQKCMKIWYERFLFLYIWKFLQNDNYFVRALLCQIPSRNYIMRYQLPLSFAWWIVIGGLLRIVFRITVLRE